MGLRVWVSTPEEFRPNAYRPRAELYCAANANFFPVGADGRPATTWAVTVGRAADWTAARADVECLDVFGPDVPDAADRAELLQTLRTTTFDQLPLARQTAILARCAALGISSGDFGVGTSLWFVVRRLISACVEKDWNFGARFNF